MIYPPARLPIWFSNVIFLQRHMRGKTEAVYGLATRTAAIDRIRYEAVVWLYERRQKLAMKEALN
jgi:hypothetical protein